MPRPKPGLKIDTHVTGAPWYIGGACLETHFGLSGLELRDMFFSEEHEDIARAKQVCGGCNITTLCLENALAFKEGFGVWGGMDVKERRVLVRRRKQEVA